MIQNYFDNVKRILGSLISNARAREGWGKGIYLFSFLKIIGSPAKRAWRPGKKKRGSGGNEFLPARPVWGWESVSAIPASAGRQNRKNFVSLIEKNFGGGRLKKCKENFSVLLAERRAETLGGIQSAKSSGFCSKWVRISSNKHHHIELVASLGASPLASAGRFARNCQGFLKSIESFCWLIWRFANFSSLPVLKNRSRFFSFAFSERHSEILSNCRCKALPFLNIIKK